ncbi:MAG: hypothetical protein AB1921_12075 [Thermodesulfobacteriota bacterium]
MERVRDMKKIILWACLWIFVFSGAAMAGSVTLTFNLEHNNITQMYANQLVQFSYGTKLVNGSDQSTVYHGVIAQIQVPPLAYPPAYAQPVTVTVNVDSGRCLNKISWATGSAGAGGPVSVPCTIEGSHTVNLSQAGPNSPIVLYYDGSAAQ